MQAPTLLCDNPKRTRSTMELAHDALQTAQDFVSGDFFKQLRCVANPNTQRMLFFLAHEATSQISMVMPEALRCSAQINNC